MKKLITGLALILMVVTFFVTAFAMTSTNYQVPTIVSGGGGGTSGSTGYSLTGMIGQSVIGGGSSASYTVDGGFWNDITQDTTAPTGTISINSGAASTNSTSATLTLSCTDTSGCSQMQFSNDNATWSTAEVYSTSKAWTLSSGDGTKTVYVKFKDGAGNWSTATISDTIILDTTAPTGATIDSVSPIFVAKWGKNGGDGSYGTGNGELYTPMGVSVDVVGNVYIADTSNRRIQKFTSDGTFITKWGKNGGDGSFGAGNGEFRNPRGVTVDSNGNVYVADTENYRIQKFTSDGTYVTQWNSYWAEDIAVDTSGNVYVPNSGNMNGGIRKYDSNGALITEWDTGSAPIGISVDSSGNVFVVCRPDNIVQKFTSNGTFITQWGTYGTGDGQFSDPRGLEVDLLGYVYVTDGNNRVQKFTSDGMFITKWGTSGTGDGQFNLPYNITVDSYGNIYVADAYNNRIQKFAPYTSSITVNNNFDYTNTTFVTLTLSCSDSGSGCSQMQFSNDNSTWSTAEAYATTKSWTLTSGDGTKTAYAKFKDGAGNWTGAYSDTIVLDTASPTGSISINSGATFTNTSSVILTLSCTDASGCAQMQFSNDNTNWSTAETYAAIKSWAISLIEGIKTVYVKYKDTAGNWSTATVSDTIVLDATAPSTTASPAGGTYTSAQSVTLTCSDGAGSGCDKIYYTTDGSTPTTSSSVYSTPISIAANTTLKFFAKDLAGNSETVRTETYTISTSSASPGALDTTFGTGGKVTTGIGSSTDMAYAVALQSDGKIVAAGYSNNGSTNYDFALVRYNIDGTLDTTFGTGGKVTTNIGSGYDDIAYALGIQSDGKIVAAGYSSGANYNNDFALVRYNADGTLDTSFGTGGKVTTDIGSSSNDIAHALGIQSDGKIVVAGGYYNGGKNDFALVRYNADGTLDTTFGTGGKVTTAIGSVGDFATALGIQSDGRIVVAGYSNSNTGSNNDFALVRYNADGTLDSTFDTDGKVTTAISGSGNDQASALVIQSDGKIVAAGYSYDGSNGGFAVVRYNTDGTLDTTFGTGGKVTTDIGSSSNDIASALALQSGGKIVVSGPFLNGTNYDFALVRYNTDGTLDTSFGTGGKVTTDIGSGGLDYAYALGIQSDGKIVAAGYSNTGGTSDFAVVRYMGDDTTPPTGTISINSGAASTNLTSATLTLSCSDDSGCSEMQFSNDNTTWSTAEAYATSKVWTLSSGDGTKTVYAKFKDTAGNWSTATISDTIMLDTTAPTTTASPAGGTYTSAQSVTLTCSDGTGSGCDKIYYTTDGSTPTTLSTVYTTPIIISATTTLKFFAKDLAGNSETVKTESYTIDTTAPTGSISINSGAASTNSTTATLTLSCTDTSGCSQMQFSNDNSSWSTPETSGTSKTWTLSSGDGTKTVYVKFKDGVGNWSTVTISDTIVLDTTAPTTTASPAGGTYTSTQSVTLTCSDGTSSGCDKIYYTTDGSTPSTLSTVYTTPITVSATTTLKFFAKDLAGNSEAVKSEAYTIDTTAPTGTISINSGAASTNSISITLTLSCTDTNGCSEMQFSNDNSTWSTAETYATSKAWTLSSGDGTKTVYVKFKDTAGNWSSTYSDTIVLDTTAPTTTASPAGGTYTSAQSVTLTCSDGTGSGCDKIYYTTDGSTPTTLSTVYTTPITISATTTLKFFAKDLAGNSEAVKTETYAITYPLTYTAGTNGTLTGTVSQTINHGGSATPVTAVPNTGYHFVNWTGTGGFVTTTSNPLTVTNVTVAQTITANFAIDTFTLTYTAGTNGTLTGTASQTINYGSSATAVTAVPATGYHFVNWTGDGGFVTTTNNPLTVTNVTTAQTITANFAIDTFAVNFASGGNGTLTGTASQTINYGSSATAVTAVPITGYHFVNWTGTGGFVATTNNPLTVTYVTAAQAITANFAIDTFAVSFVSGGNGTLTGTASQTINYGSSATAVTAVPATGYHFVNWTGDGGFVTTNSNPLTVTNVTAAQTITANFAITSYDITVSKTGTGTGTISSSDSLINCGADCIETHNHGTTVALTATADTGSTFTGWSGACSGTGSCTITMDAAKSVTATFADIALPVLAVSTLSDGAVTNNWTLNISGTVTDNSGVHALTVNGNAVTINTDDSFSHALVLYEGANIITTVVTDLAGNQTTDTRTITLDTRIALNISNPADNSKTALSVTTVTGTVDENATVTITTNGGTPQYASITGNTFTLDIVLASGVNTIEVTATDLAGNTSTQKRTVTSDNTKPSLEITSPNQDIKTNQGSIIVKGTVSDTLTAVSVSVAVDGNTYTPTLTNGQFEQTVTFTAEKTYTINVTATDEAGNATTAQRNIIYDITRPALTFTVMTPTNANSQIITGTMEEGSTVMLTSATANVGIVIYPTATTWSVNVTGMAEGSNTITATAKDIAGNETTVAKQIVVDTVAPVTTATPGGGAYTSTQIVTLTANETVTIRYTVDGTIPTTSSLVYNVPITVAGSTVLSFFATDAAGNAEGVKTLAYSINPVAAIDATPPANPSSLNSTSNRDGSISLSWTAPTDADLKGYNVYRDGTKINTSLVTTSRHTDTNTVTGSSYTYKITSLDLAGNESSGVTKTATSSVQLNTPPAMPGNIKVEDTGTGYSLNVVWSSNTESDLAGYKVYWGTASGTYPNSQNVGNITAYEITGLTQGTRYYVAVSAYDTDGNESAKSIESTGTPKAYASRPDPVTGLTVIPGNGYLTLSWTGVSNVTGYMVYIGETDGVYGTPVRTANTTYTFQNLQNGKAYYIAVSSYDLSTGSRYTVSSESERTTSSGAPYDNEPPAVPSNLSATDTGTSGSISLKWDREESFDIAGYMIAYKVSGTSAFTGMQSIGIGWSHTITGLVNGTNYTFNVYAYDAAGNFSDPASSQATPTVSVSTVDLTPPDVPILSAVPGNGKVTLIISSTGNDADHYNLYVYNLASGKYMPLISISGLSYEHSTGVDNGKALVFVATAVDAAGNESGYSEPASVVPNELPGDIPLEEDPPVLDRVDGYDVNEIAKGFGSGIGNPNYNPNSDLDGNGKIDGDDLMILGTNHGKKKE